MQLPQRLVDVIAIRQQLLSQYDKLQSRIKDLKEAAENEVLCHNILTNKPFIHVKLVFYSQSEETY